MSTRKGYSTQETPKSKYYYDSTGDKVGEIQLAYPTGFNAFIWIDGAKVFLGHHYEAKYAERAVEAVLDRLTNWEVSEMSESVIVTVLEVEKLRNSSYGNPCWEIVVSTPMHGLEWVAAFRTGKNCQAGYQVYRGLVGKTVELRFSDDDRIAYIKEI